MRPLSSILLVVFAICAFAGCQCITVPTNDSIAPVATLSVQWDGSGITHHVNTTDHNIPIVVVVPAGKTFVVTYAGNDAGGVKNLHVDYQFRGPTVGGVATSGQPLIAVDDFSSCAQTNRIVVKDFPYQPATREWYNFSSSATDFKGNRAVTPTITVQYGPPPAP